MFTVTVLTGFTSCQQNAPNYISDPLIVEVSFFFLSLTFEALVYSYYFEYINQTILTSYYQNI